MKIMLLRKWWFINEHVEEALCFIAFCVLLILFLSEDGKVKVFDPFKQGLNWYAGDL